MTTVFHRARMRPSKVDIANALMEIAFPNAQQPQNASAAGNAADEILRFKVLLDQGIITEEEFTAKKRQLLGI